MGTQNAAPLRLTDFGGLAAGHVTRDRHRPRPRIHPDAAKNTNGTPSDLDRSAVRP
ncbi:hypothetical protein [Catenulispora rubra]|uniref:hypothetical protein n=1 Tax=Catenulispora rubra TaxID=280293 RepID=UPI0018924D87|nr:hypothetical protein [Catenulispora rubra]